MHRVSPALLCLFSTLTVSLLPGADREPGLDARYEFRSGDYAIRMTVAFPPPYEGRRLEVFQGGDQPTCLAGNMPGGKCAEHFVGSIAVVKFQVTPFANKGTRGASIREVVKELDRSPELPPRPVFEMRVGLLQGLGSDVQAFGYDEDSLPVEERRSEREESRRMWRHFEQELYLNQDIQPFAKVEWRHATSGIQLLRIEGSPGGQQRNNRR